MENSIEFEIKNVFKFMKFHKKDYNLYVRYRDEYTVVPAHDDMKFKVSKKLKDYNLRRIKLCVNLVLLIIIYIFEVFYDNKFAKICSYIITAFYSIIVLLHIILLIWIKK